MKIIKKGTKTLPEDKVYVTRCRTCGCKFTYRKTDITIQEYGLHDFFEFVVCPQCSYMVFVPFIKKKYKGEKND